MTIACHNEDPVPVESSLEQWLCVVAWQRVKLGQACVLLYWPTVIFSSGTSWARCGASPQQNFFPWTGPTSLWKPHELAAFLLFGRASTAYHLMCEELWCFQYFNQALFDVPVTFDDFVDCGSVNFLSWRAFLVQNSLPVLFHRVKLESFPFSNKFNCCGFVGWYPSHPLYCSGAVNNYEHL